MKKFLIIAVAVGLSIMVSAQKQPKFFIICTTSGDTASKYAGSFERVLASYLTDAFPCSRSRTQGDIRTKVAREHLNQLLGGETNWGSFCDDLACDYLVNLELADFMSSQVIVSASVIDYRKKSPLVRDAKYGARNYAGIKKMVNEVSKNIVDKLQEFEICPYLGPLTVEVKSELNDTKTDYQPSPCGGGSASITTTITTNSTLTWKLNKVDRRVTEGNASYDLYEHYNTVSNYPCYICKNGQKGGAKITEDQTSEAKVEGISDESTFRGKQIKDARISIIFNDDKTYTVLVEGTSTQGTMKITSEKKVEGVCQDESEPEKPKNKAIDVPFKAVFGPYPGTPEDKVLQQNETKDVSQNKEKTTVKIDFTLTRN